ncbi:MAG: pentapeptide repeat-containing protein [Deltaproteobacteria bacterium]|nr:MAG: pentapeptide repeat-containing protein [Deltaproteobacteria bacterium]
MSLLELLQRGDVDAFNASRSLRDRPDLFAADLAEKRLVGADLSAAKMAKADLTGADLTDATLARADLSGSDGTGVDLTRALALKVKLRGAWFDRAILEHADLTRADLTETVLAQSSGEGVRLSGASLRRADCKGVRWPSADLAEARLHQCDLTDADLRAADFTEAVATEVVFENARLDGLIGPRSNLAESRLTGASLVGADLREANLSQADLTRAKLRGADLSRANLTDATLTDVDLREACLADANLQGVDLSSAQLEGADLSGHDARALGLSEEVLVTLSAWGAAVAEDAPIVVSEPASARHGDRVALLWLNPDTDTLSTLRWAVLGPDAASHGVLATSAEGVVARMVVPTSDGFMLLALIQRPGGTSLHQVDLSLDGVAGVPRNAELRYTPAVVPVVEPIEGGIRLTGLSRRGPAIVVQALRGGEVELLSSAPVPTASGFWSEHSAVVATRGGVVIPVIDGRVGDPVRTPTGFPGRTAKVIEQQGELVAVWFEPNGVPDEPGWIRWAVLGGRGKPEVHTLHRAMRLKSLAVAPSVEGVQVAWVEAQDLLVSLTYRATLPGEGARFLQAAGDAAAEVQWARPAPGHLPALIVTTLEEQVLVLDQDERLAVFLS